MKRVGRPSKQKKITVDQAVQMTQEFWAQYDRKGYSKQYIYNLISANKLKSEHTGKYVFIFEDEVRQKLCG
jgi:hypothetical protein